MGKVISIGNKADLNEADFLQALAEDTETTVIASYLGWTLDAFDFFLMVFVLKDIAAEVGGLRSIPALAGSLAWLGGGIGGIMMGRIGDIVREQSLKTVTAQISYLADAILEGALRAAWRNFRAGR